METRTITFDSLHELTDYVDKAIKENRWEVIKEIRQRQGGREKFFGDTNLENTMQAARYGLKEYTNYFLDNIKDIKPEGDMYDDIFLDYQGFAYDMGSVVAGVPECCINCGAPSISPTITIYVDITFYCGTKAKQIQNRGIAITNLINTLIARKYIIDLYFIDYNCQSDMNTLITTKIDAATLSVATVAFMCSPQFFRQMSWIATDELRNNDSCLGRGQSRLTEEMRKKIKDENIFYIGGSYTDEGCLDHYNNVNEANTYIAKKFNKFCEQQKAA